MSQRSTVLPLILVISFAVNLVWATPPNVKVNSDTSPFLQNEQQIWISPFDANIVIADWRDWRFSYRRVAIGVTTDGGATWADQMVPDIPYEKQSDPCLTGDQYGNFYACMLNYSDIGPSLIVVYKSTNNGASWTGPVATGPVGDYFEDKQFTTIDRTGGAHDGNYYVSWTRFPNPDRIMFVRSIDGTASFEDTVLIGPSPYWEPCGGYLDAGQFSIPIVDADGDVHVFWQGYDLIPGECSGYRAIQQVLSTDGGASFDEQEVAFYNNLGYEWVDGNIDVYGMPNGDCDISGGPYNNTIYISQCQYAEGYEGETDVTVRKSTDKGLTWTDRQVVNDDTPAEDCDQFHPWLVVNEDGVVLLIFYDQRDDVSHWKFNSYFSCSFDGGETYIKNMRISDVSIDPSMAKFRPSEAGYQEIKLPGGLVSLQDRMQFKPRAGLFAEYIGIHANHDTVSTIWTDTRDGTQDCYSARFIIPFDTPRLYLPENYAFVDTGDVSLRWSTCWHESQDSYRLEISKDATFITVDQVYPGLTDNNFTLPVGLDIDTYYWRVKAFRAAGDSTDYSEVWQFAAIEFPIPEVLSVQPAPNELGVPVSAEIEVDFSTNMNASTLDDASVAVHGAARGRYSGAVAYDTPSDIATLTPAQVFLPAEEVSVTLTPEIESEYGVSLQSYVWSFLAAAGEGPGTFAADAAYDVGGFTYSVCAADLDGDDDLDLAAADYDSGDVVVLLNLGDGTYGSYTAYAANDHHSTSVAPADFDGDGDVDLAAAGRQVDNVSVLLNNGDGTFAPDSDYPVSGGPVHICAGDFDGDGDLDLATADYDGGHVSVLLNNGDGVFAGAATYPTAAWPGWVIAADLDGDFDIDLATANDGSLSLSVLLNDGEGGFAAPVSYSFAGGPAMAGADLDGDGDVDFTIPAEIGGLSDEDSVGVYLNDGSGVFALDAFYAAGGSVSALTLGDLNGDGVLDLSTANWSDRSISVLTGNGDGTLAAKQDYPLDQEPFGICAADVDGDADIDLVTANEADSNVTVMLNLRLYVCGDADGNGIVNVSDAVLLISYIFGGGPPPDPLEAGDVNCDETVNISDAVYLIAYIFGGGPAPCAACP